MERMTVSSGNQAAVRVKRQDVGSRRRQSLQPIGASATRSRPTWKQEIVRWPIFRGLISVYAGFVSWSVSSPERCISLWSGK